MKDLFIESIIIACGIYMGLTNIADALEHVSVEMNTKVRIVDTESNGTP